MDPLPSSPPKNADFIKHPVFWFDDGSVILRVQEHAFKLHGKLLSRHSTFLSEHILASQSTSAADLEKGPHLVIDPSRCVKAEDLEVLLEHFYHDAPLFSEVRYTRIAAVLRVSSPPQLDFPSIHTRAAERLSAILVQPDDKEDLAASTRKFLYYNIVTSPDSEFETQAELDGALQSSPDSTPVDLSAGPTVPESVPTTPPTPSARPLSPTDSKLCTALMSALIAHFTPTLFTPPATSHMACTDVFADTWMTRIIAPALEDGGVYKPLETLERMKEVQWEADGVCAGCVREKKEEWTEEQRGVWRAMDGWLIVQGEGVGVGEKVQVS